MILKVYKKYLKKLIVLNQVEKVRNSQDDKFYKAIDIVANAIKNNKMVHF